MLIAIDGNQGVGKTELANTITTEFSYVGIDLDDFLFEEKGGYVDFIQYDNLTDSIQANKNGKIVISGVCVIQVLERIGIVPDLHIYIKLLYKDGFWNDGFMLFNPDMTADQKIYEIHESRRKFWAVEGQPYTPESSKAMGLKEDIIRYHYSYKPHEKADLIFNRIKDR